MIRVTSDLLVRALRRTYDEQRAHCVLTDLFLDLFTPETGAMRRGSFSEPSEYSAECPDPALAVSSRRGGTPLNGDYWNVTSGSRKRATTNLEAPGGTWQRIIGAPGEKVRRITTLPSVCSPLSPGMPGTNPGAQSNVDTPFECSGCGRQLQTSAALISHKKYCKGGSEQNLERGQESAAQAQAQAAGTTQERHANEGSDEDDDEEEDPPVNEWCAELSASVSALWDSEVMEHTRESSKAKHLVTRPCSLRVLPTNRRSEMPF